MVWPRSLTSRTGVVSNRVATQRGLSQSGALMQDKSSLGTRFTCYECGKKFYDLNKPEPVCPGCSANQFEDPTPDPRVAVMERYKGSRMTAKDAAPSKLAFAVEEKKTSDPSEEDLEEEVNTDVDLDENEGDSPPEEPVE